MVEITIKGSESKANEQLSGKALFSVVLDDKGLSIMNIVDMKDGDVITYPRIVLAMHKLVKDTFKGVANGNDTLEKTLMLEFVKIINTELEKGETKCN